MFQNYVTKQKRSADERHMKTALEAAEAAKSQGEQARGAVLVMPTRVYSESQSVLTGDPTCHAEMNVIRKVAPTTRNLQDGILYATTEPCAMCMAAAMAAGIKEVVFGAYDKTNGFSTAKKLNMEGADVNFLGGVLAESCYSIASPSLKEHLSHETPTL